MHDSSNFASEHPFLAFLHRLTALYWFFLLVFFPIWSLSRIRRAIRCRRATKNKHERRFWLDEIWLFSGTFYISASLFYHLFQDLILAPFSFATKAQITFLVEMILGIPGMFWYAFTDRAVLQADDAGKFFMVTFFAVLAVVIILLIKAYMEVNGKVDVDGTWVPNKTASKQEWDRYTKEEEAYWDLSKDMQALMREEPIANTPTWRVMSKEEQQHATEDWQRRVDALREKMDSCPRYKKDY